jgi:hypothetical protein
VAGQRAPGRDAADQSVAPDGVVDGDDLGATRGYDADPAEGTAERPLARRCGELEEDRPALRRPAVGPSGQGQSPRIRCTCSTCPSSSRRLSPGGSPPPSSAAWRRDGRRSAHLASIDVPPDPGHALALIALLCTSRPRALERPRKVRCQRRAEAGRMSAGDGNGWRRDPVPVAEGPPTLSGSRRRGGLRFDNPCDRSNTLDNHRRDRPDRPDRCPRPVVLILARSIRSPSPFGLAVAENRLGGL